MPHSDDNIVRCGIFCAFLSNNLQKIVFFMSTRRALCESTRMLEKEF